MLLFKNSSTTQTEMLFHLISYLLLVRFEIERRSIMFSGTVLSVMRGRYERDRAVVGLLGGMLVGLQHGADDLLVERALVDARLALAQPARVRAHELVVEPAGCGL